MAWRKTILLLLFFQNSSVHVAEANQDSLLSRSSQFKLWENKRLLRYSFERFDSPSLFSCGQQCLRNQWCSSTNFKLSTKNDVEGSGTCELNKHDFTAVKDNINFVDQQDVTFSMLLKGCQLTNCLNGGSCLPDIKRQTFSCACKYPWIGERCENTTDQGISCKEIYERKLANENKAYPIQLGSKTIPVFCHMTSLGACVGGGWTLVMKMNGSQSTFHYDSHLWSNKETFNINGGKTGFDSRETKLPTYWNTSFTKICLGMRIGQHINFILINQQANSLYSLIADGKPHRTSLRRYTWMKLIGSLASLQSNCGLQGFNVRCSKNLEKARIGILGNNENDCRTCDSRIGFGTGGTRIDSNSCGNVHVFTRRNIKAMGYILVR